MLVAHDEENIGALRTGHDVPSSEIFRWGT
jgi:hypothetical protein